MGLADGSPSLWASGATRSAKVIILFEGAPLQVKSLCILPMRPQAPHLLEIVVFHELLKLLDVANRHQVLLHMRERHEVICEEEEGI